MSLQQNPALELYDKRLAAITRLNSDFSSLLANLLDKNELWKEQVDYYKLDSSDVSIDEKLRHPHHYWEQLLVFSNWASKDLGELASIDLALGTISQQMHRQSQVEGDAAATKKIFICVYCCMN